MIEMARMHFNHFNVAQQYARWQRYARSQPSWILVAAVSAGLLLVFGFIVILLLLAAAGFFIVFLPMAIVYRLVSSARSWFTSGPRQMTPRDDGRRNVRVVMPSERTT